MLDLMKEQVTLVPSNRNKIWPSENKINWLKGFWAISRIMGRAEAATDIPYIGEMCLRQKNPSIVGERGSEVGAGF